MSTFTYDLTTLVGKTRFEVGDNDLSKVAGDNRETWTACFSDEEIQYALDDSNQSIKYTAYRLIMAIASNKAMMSKRQRVNGGVDRDLALTAKGLREHAQALFQEALSEGQVEEFVPVTWNDFTFRERLGYRQ